MKLKRLWALAAMLLVLCMGITAQAAPVPDTSRLCSVTFAMEKNGVPVPGGTLALYLVGVVAEDDGNYSFAPTGGFAACGESFADPEDAGLAARLQAFAEESDLSPLKTETISADGAVTFADLPTGLYLVVQPQAAPGYAAIEPFLVGLPYLENGEYQYDLTAKPKTELTPGTTPTPSPGVTPTPVPGTTPTPVPDATPTPGPQLPQTGQLWWPVPMLVCGGLALVALGFALNRRKRTDET